MSKHFKLIHGLKEVDTYRCTFDKKIVQYFSSCSSLTQHFKAHLKSSLINYNNEPQASSSKTSSSSLLIITKIHLKRKPTAA